MKRQTIRNVAFWTTTILGPASFVIGGVLNLSQSEQVTVTMRHLGYPIYFASILGFWKLAGAIAIVAPGMPRLKEWAYAGFFFELTAAAASRAAVGDSVADVIAPLVFLALVMASWALRPSSRMLVSAGAAPSVPGQLLRLGRRSTEVSAAYQLATQTR
jgi:uncharacterized membrane protein YphA (DoxX/SURF4 family)